MAHTFARHQSGDTMAVSDDSSQGAQVWQRKYYDSLEDIEKKEKQWAGVEDLLRRTISRLTLAADGLDSTLDRQLKELRDAIRDREDSRTLSSKIESMSRTLVKLDRERSHDKATAVPPTQPLLQLLEQLQLPRGTGRQVKKLKKALASATVDSPLEPLIKDFTSLLGEALTLVQEQPHETTDSTRKDGGLLKRLFGKPGAESTAAQNVTPEIDSLEPARQLLVDLADQANRLAPTAKAAELQQRALRARETRELHALGTELLHSLQAPASTTTEIPQDLAEDPVTAIPAMGTEEALLRLLEQLQLPGEYSAQVEALQDRLERSGTDTDWPTLLDDIAALVHEMRNRILAEKKELEDFLKQLTGRLQEVDEHLHGSEVFREASLQNSRDLDAAVKQEVRGIESSVRDAADLQQLKHEVQAHLENIVTQLEEHQREEEQSHQRATEEMALLQDRLKVMEEETEQLRGRVREERIQAMTDTLTGIPNRMAFDERIADEVARWKRFHTPLALLVWDVDKFKVINDNYGHKAGDKVLKTVAHTLQSQVRETDFLARFGGEEFVLIMTGTELPVIQEVADKLRESVAACGFHFRGNSVQVTISCGIALFTEGDNPEGVFDRADQALYRAKENGRNRCEIAT